MFHSRHPLEVGHHVGLFQALLSCLDLCVLPWESRLELILSLSWKFSRQDIPNRGPCEVQKEWIRPLALHLNGRVPGLKSPSSMVSTIACVWEMKIFLQSSSGPYFHVWRNWGIWPSAVSWGELDVQVPKLLPPDLWFLFLCLLWTRLQSRFLGTPTIPQAHCHYRWVLLSASGRLSSFSSLCSCILPLLHQIRGQQSGGSWDLTGVALERRGGWKKWGFWHVHS